MALAAQQRWGSHRDMNPSSLSSSHRYAMPLRGCLVESYLKHHPIINGLSLLFPGTGGEPAPNHPETMRLPRCYLLQHVNPPEERIATTCSVSGDSMGRRRILSLLSTIISNRPR